MIRSIRVFRGLAPAGFVLLLIALAGCEFGPSTSDSNVQIIDIETFDEFVRDDARTLIVDPRPAQRYGEGHIPGAINLPINRLRGDSPELSEAQRIIVYAQGPGDFLSTAAAKKLIALGYANVFDFRGGIELWQAEGRELETGSGAETP